MQYKNKQMRKYVDSVELSREIKGRLARLEMTQAELAQAVDATQGEISHILSGKFKTENDLVQRICKYVKIRTQTFRSSPPRSRPPKEAVQALAHACRGSRLRTQTVVRILRALEGLE